MDLRRRCGASLWAGTLAILLALGGLAACGGGSTEGGEEGFVGQLPDEGPGTPGTTPDPGGTTGTPPPTEPPAEPPAEPSEGPPVEPPVGPPVGPGVPPRQDVPPPPEALPSFEGFPGVLGVTFDRATGTWYAIQAESGRIVSWRPEEQQPTVIGETGIDGFAALAYVPTEDLLYAVTQRDGVDAELYRISPVSPAAELVGTITGYRRIEGLTWHGPSEALFAVDAEKDVVIRLDPASPGASVKVADLGLIQSPVALASDPDHDVLYAVDDASADIVAIEPTTGTVHRMATLVEGTMLGLAFDPGTRRFFGASPAGHLRVLDPMGEWMEPKQILGLAYDEAGDVLYGTYVPHALLVRIERESEWRQVLGYLALPRLEGLAYDGANHTLWAVSRSRREIYRIDPSSLAVQTIGEVKDAGGQISWTGLSSLEFVDGRLIAVDADTGTVLDIDPSSATGMALTTVSPQGDIRSLAFDPNERLLHAAGNRTGAHFVLKVDAAWIREEGTQIDDRRIGGLAWIPGEERLLGTELTLNRLVQVAPLEGPALPFDDIAALAVSHGDVQLMGFDVDKQVLLGLQPGVPEAQTLEGMAGSAIYGMAYAPGHDVYYAADANSGTLWRITREGQHEAVAGGGTLATVVLHALAYDGTNEVLWGVDRDTRRLVTIDTGSGVATVAFPALDPLPYESVEAMSWDPDTGTLVAVDQATRQLIEIDAITGEATPYAEIELAAVTGAAIVPETGELLVVDTDVDLVLRLDRFTGAFLDPFEALAVHRGLGDDDAISLLWPHGEVRAGAWGSFAIQVGDQYEKKGALVFRRGKDVLFERAFEPKRILTIERVPAAVHEAVKVGDVVTWGITFGDEVEVVAAITVVDRPAAEAAVSALTTIPSLETSKPWIRAACAARILSRHGLHTEAVETLAASPDLPQEKKGIERAFATAMRGMEHADSGIGALVRYLDRLGKALR